MRRVILILTVMLLAGPMAAAAQSIEGVWRLAEFESANLPAPTEVTGLMIFADGHYSRAFVRASEPRRPTDQSATPEEILAAWGPFIANSGTYTVDGSTLTFQVVVAKVPAAMRTSTTVEVRFEGDSLWLSGESVEGATDTRQRWIRVTATCEAVGEIQFICGVISPEDLAIVPGAEWVIASGDQEGGRIQLVSVRDKTATPVFPTPTRTERLDAATYPTCPGPIDPQEGNDFRAHGLYLNAGSGGVHTLYVVHHGFRESIEVFEVDARATPPALTWVGCAVAPEPLGLNAVVALPEGGFVATSPRTGDVWEWHTGSGWTRIPGSEDTAPNGLEISSDGRWLYVAGFREKKLTRLSRGQTPVQKDVVALDFRPDNLRMSADGSVILAAGPGNVQTPRELSRETSNVAKIDPQTLEVQQIFRHPFIDGFGASTTAVQIGNETWLGTYRGEMIAYFPVRE